jgi:drug/metabolite transporter superfamily protein YnfA
VEGIAPDRWDLVGAGIAVLGALVVLRGPRS